MPCVCRRRPDLHPLKAETRGCSNLSLLSRKTDQLQVKAINFGTQPISKCLYAAMLFFRFWTDEVIGAPGGKHNVERRDQPTAAQIVMGQYGVGEKYAGALQRSIERMV